MQLRGIKEKIPVRFRPIDHYLLKMFMVISFIAVLGCLSVLAVVYLKTFTLRQEMRIAMLEGLNYTTDPENHEISGFLNSILRHDDQ